MPEAPTRIGSIIERDRGLLWHPYAPLDGPSPYQVVGASGARLKLKNDGGRVLDAVDAMSSWWSTIHGYCHPALDAAIREQTATFSHVMFGGLTHQPAVLLAERLIDRTPEPLQHVFFADSGSVAVEVALKMAIQYQAAVGRAERWRFAALRGGYHGDTAGAMSVCDPVDGMHAAFSGHLTAQLFLPRPPAAKLHHGELSCPPGELANWAAAVDQLLEQHRTELAGIIVEPVLQGAGGMFVYSPDCLLVLRQAADRYGLLLILDEIATGFGRTGKWLASDWTQNGQGKPVVPDILCLGKALTGGYLSLAAVLGSAELASAIESGPQNAIQHGPTFMANPLACAVALASLELLDGKWQHQVSAIEQSLVATLLPLAEQPGVREVRVLGAVGVVELSKPVDVQAATEAALQRGVWIRPFRNLIYTMPPYISSAAEISTIGAAITAAVERVQQ
ncbi:adenosylmethionine-8-amino-7-oxononanoate aminotransferase [Psychromicrobium lacuslunae]|uniref:Adenosylmethionine-8-amino-7-oxononanoate aminotransferase n=1 Tax=Psychromicrobium lacuslunae TaxID=1618207 RepID=A0A0D4C3T3_9MICC|nr:adenosylmethionine-8-amino-7-oxononanoate aminotransferase [Psychromicrobium lacuslunae]